MPRPPDTESSTPDEAWIRELRRRLDAWYLENARDLPWRRTSDPYRIWLSESMLQQTRVDTVIPYYERFLARFPTAQALADADESDVLKEWAGLGYYSRARNLKRAAEQIVRDHGGQLPSDAEQLSKLPGVGPYTVGAIRSIAFGQAAPLVDGNVARVFSRWLAEPEMSSRQQWQLAEQLVPSEHPERFNQALMELGAMVCTPKLPKCGACPVREQCEARQLGTPESYPKPRKRASPKPVRAVAAVIERGSRPLRRLVVRRPSRGLLGGLWELPSFELGSFDSLEAAVRERTGLRVEVGRELGVVRHVFSHRTLTLVLKHCSPLDRRATAPPPLSTSDDMEARWCSDADLAELPISRLMQKVLLELEAARRRLL